MSRSDYYQALKQRAREVRSEYGLKTPRVLKSDLRRIYKTQEIKIDWWPPKGISGGFKNLRGAYMHDEHGTTVTINRNLPDEPAIFTMGHELKHHLTDKMAVLYCDLSNQNEVIEIGAEIFAAELIFPDEEFADALTQMGVVKLKCSAKDLVCFKHETRTTLSYQAIIKKAEFLGFVLYDQFRGIQFKKLEEQLYGEPVYKRILRYRQQRATWR